MSDILHSLTDLIRSRQHNRILRLSFPHNDEPSSGFLVNKLDAKEGLSQDFDFTVQLLSSDASLALKEMQGKLLSIGLVRKDGSLRYFTGYVFSFRRQKSDGNITFYEAKLGPWFKFLSLRKDNYLFHSKSLREQTESIFSDYSFYPQWEWRVTGDDPVWTDACQFDETDHNYLNRRWEAAGWHYWYEHTREGHKLIVGDNSTQASAIEGQVEVRFHAAGGAAEEDAIDRWSPVRHLAPSSVVLRGFDFKRPTPTEVSIPTLNRQGDVPDIEYNEYVGAYAFKDPSAGDALAKVYIEELEAASRYYEAEGNNRYLLPGHSFELTDHFNHSHYDFNRQLGRNDFLILAIHHTATNNYLRPDDGQTAYRNRFTCLRKEIPWRPRRNFNSTITKILAPQTAIVVGPSGQDSIHTDEYGRVRVQFHWDRIGDNDEHSSAWIRVASSWAGAELGATAIPRMGAEVIVQWLDGNPDRPIITGSVYNERNMPPWSVPSQQALMGLRSRELAPNAGNIPGGRSNHLIFDDTHQEIQAQLKSDHRCSQLSLGHITRIDTTEGRKDSRGEGWEIATDAWGVARAGRGILITTEARNNAASHSKDMGETVQRLTAARAMQESQAELAQQNGALDIGQQASVADALKTQNDAIQGKGVLAGENRFPELSQPHLVLSSPAGIATTTAQSTHIASEANTAITTGKSVSITAGDGLVVSIKQTIRLFVHKAGMKLIAAAGDIDIKALSDSVNLLAKLNITAAANRIIINAKEEIIINGGGSYSRYSTAGIEHGTNGTFVAHATSHSLTAPKSVSQAFNEMPISHFDQIPILEDLDGPLANRKFELTREDGTVVKGVTDSNGRVPIQKGIDMATAKLRILGE